VSSTLTFKTCFICLTFAVCTSIAQKICRYRDVTAEHCEKTAQKLKNETHTVAKGRGQDLRFANIQVSLSASAWRSRRHNLHVSRISVACSSVFDGKDRRSTSAKILHFGKTREAARQRVTKVDFAFDTHRQGSMTKRVALAASALKKAR